MPKAWWTEVDEDDLAAELRFLEWEIYLGKAELRRDVLTAYERLRPGSGRLRDGTTSGGYDRDEPPLLRRGAA